MVLILIALVLLPIAFPALTLQLAGFISIWVLNCGTIWSMIMHAMIGALPFFCVTFVSTISKNCQSSASIEFMTLRT